LWIGRLKRIIIDWTKLDVQGIPFLLEASNPETLIILHTLAKSLSYYVLTADSETRLKYHLSAVLANNFVNYLYTESARLLEDSGLDFNVLKPIIKETALKIQNLPPAEAQTGPAKRGDQPTIEKHLALIKTDKELSKQFIEHSLCLKNKTTKTTFLSKTTPLSNKSQGTGQRNNVCINWVDPTIQL
jgi:hypothetical protein